MTQQEHVIFSNVPSSTDQSAQCNIRTREATEYRQDLKVAKVKLEKLKIHQLSGKEAISPEKAERIVQGLIRQRIGMIDDRNDELAVLHLEYRLAQIQMDLGRYQNAEATARNVYDKRREFHVAGTSEADLHCSQTQLCESLRRQKTKSKLRQAENMYRMVWNEEDVSERPLRDNHVFWRLENGHNLGIILGEEEKFRPAEDQHREVMAERIEILGCAHVDTAQSAVEVIHNLRKQPDPVDLLSKIHKVVEPIWQSSKKAKELSPLVLWCGAQLGESFYSITKFYEAGTVLRDVWEARKKFCSSDPSDAISTARLLILSLEALGLSQEADTVVDWVGEMTQAQQKAVFTSMPEEFQVNTRSLCRRQKFAEAALVSKEEWKSCSMRQDIDTLDERTLNACYFYGSAVSQIPHTTTQDASSAIAAVQGVYNLLPVTKLSDGSTLKIYYLYAYMLYSMSNNVSGATNVLTNAYTMKRTVKLA
ncbi:hypothetical protein MMC34_002631 [Xylographa carneopallida]|nr:hypothetical protein [Xylographa carneopallida]